ncbi:hypothetical protein LZ32DRAFT_652068 [Colletotrichum eremochloae]|nr:hypothetical protein LZ32DRAFT_652068 [Colletotrichum eremochloae]
MASVAFLTDDNEGSALQSSGFLCEEDARLGTLVSMKGKGLPLLSKDGLEFLRINILNNERVQSVLLSFFPRCGLGRFQRFHSDPGHIFQFRRGGEESGPHVLAVMLWEPGSRCVYYDGSHRKALPGVTASNGLWEVPFAALVHAGCSEGSKLTFEHGGLSIHDGRLSFEIKEGAPIAAIFATPEVLVKWSKMVLPNTPEMVDKVAELSRENQRVVLHMRFDTTGTSDQSSLVMKSDVESLHATSRGSTQGPS